MNADTLKSHCRHIKGYTLLKLGGLLSQSHLIHEGRYELRIARLQLAYGRARGTSPPSAIPEHPGRSRDPHAPDLPPRQPPVSPY